MWPGVDRVEHKEIEEEKDDEEETKGTYSLITP